MKRFIHFISYLGLFSAYVLLFIVIYWLFYPYKVVEYKILPLPVVKNRVHAGDTVQLRNVFCKLMDVKLEAQVSIEDGFILNLPSLHYFTPKGCYDRLGFYKIPEFLSPGDTARIHIALNYQVNPIRTITYQLFSEPFTIISSTSSAIINY